MNLIIKSASFIYLNWVHGSECAQQSQGEPLVHVERFRAVDVQLVLSVLPSKAAFQDVLVVLAESLERRLDLSTLLCGVLEGFSRVLLSGRIVRVPVEVRKLLETVLHVLHLSFVVLGSVLLEVVRV